MTYEMAIKEYPSLEQVTDEELPQLAEEGDMRYKRAVYAVILRRKRIGF